jgi:hypothetical protein
VAHGFERWKAETLVKRRIDEGGGGAVSRSQRLVGPGFEAHPIVDTQMVDLFLLLRQERTPPGDEFAPAARPEVLVAPPAAYVQQRDDLCSPSVALASPAAAASEYPRQAPVRAGSMPKSLPGPAAFSNANHGSAMINRSTFGGSHKLRIGNSSANNSRIMS